MQETKRKLFEKKTIDMTIPKEIAHHKRLVYRITKRIIDIIGSAVGLILLSPVFLITAIAIKIDSKGPAFYSQKRVGLNGKIFKMYKFRSMVVNAEKLLEKLKDKNEMDGPMFKIKDDPRVTKIGNLIRKTSIDELPQIYNVLRGKMSLVGPRPNLPKEVEKFSEYQRKKLIVAPGLTCYWQVMGRNTLEFEDWIKLDIKYIEDRSTFLDVVLIIKTFKVLLGDKDAA